MPTIEIAEGHVTRLTRLAEEYEIGMDKLVSLIVVVGVEMLEDPDEKPIAYELVHREDL